MKIKYVLGILAKPNINENLPAQWCQNIQLTYKPNCQYTKKVFHHEYFIAWWWMASIIIQVYAFIKMKPKNILSFLIKYENGTVLMFKVMPNMNPGWKNCTHHIQSLIISSASHHLYIQSLNLVIIEAADALALRILLAPNAVRVFKQFF